MNGLDRVERHAAPAGVVAETPTSRCRQQRIADGFSRAAHAYDDGAELQREVADHLLARLPALGRLRTVVDIGCGTGYLISRLDGRHAGLAIGLDIAPGMLQAARRRHIAQPIQWLVGSAERLPLADDSAGLLVSSLAVQWCESLEGFLAEAGRVLRPGGWLAFTTLCEGTLAELRAAGRRLDGKPHGNAFLPEAGLAKILEAPGWQLHELDLATRKTHHATPIDALRALKRIGASTLTDPAAGHGGLAGRRRIVELGRRLETWREAEGIPTRYRVATVLLQRSEREER